MNLRDTHHVGGSARGGQAIALRVAVGGGDARMVDGDAVVEDKVVMM